MTAMGLGRRALAGASLSTLATPTVAGGTAAQTLRMVPHSDLVWLDPTFWPYLITRNHALMVYDTLYGCDAAGIAQPQMAEGHTVENDGRLWRIRLREGLVFHDGTPVLARDCVASIVRWGTHATMGQSLLAATHELTAPDDRTIQFRLANRFPLLPDALASRAMQPCVVMPARLAEGNDFRAITEVTGSGPYRYLPEERVRGRRVAYARHQAYLPRADGVASFMAGPKIAHFERVEWLPMAVPELAQEALLSGRVDWWEAPEPGSLAALSADPRLVVRVCDPGGFMGTLRMNHLTAPFNVPAARRALLRAVDQAAFMAATGAAAEYRRDQVGFFCPPSTMANAAGLAAMPTPPDDDGARAALRAAGALGASIVVVGTANLPPARAMAELGAAMLRRIGFEVELVLVELRDLVQLLLRTQPAGAGGWNIVFGYWSGHDMWDPGMHRYLRGDGPAGEIGWPTSESIEALRHAWLMAPDAAARPMIAADIQAQAFVDVPYVPLGQWLRPTAHDRRLQGMLDGFPLFWNLRREG